MSDHLPEELTLEQAVDLSQARDYLVTHPQSKVVAVKDGRVLGSNEGNGVLPLLELVDRIGSEMHGASVADRVIGQAAAFILIKARVAAAFGELLSGEAEARLQEHKIFVDGAKRVPMILGRDRTGRCLMEQQVLGVDDPTEAVSRLKQFFAARSHDEP